MHLQSFSYLTTLLHLKSIACTLRHLLTLTSSFLLPPVPVSPLHSLPTHLTPRSDLRALFPFLFLHPPFSFLVPFLAPCLYRVPFPLRLDRKRSLCRRPLERRLAPLLRASVQMQVVC